jgi:subtilisin family serine protease
MWVQTPGVLGSNFNQVPRTNNYVSSPGGAIDVAAPGVDIFTTGPGVGTDGIGHNYGFATGTSLAAPHVAGLVALYIAANGRATNADGVYRIRQAIVNAGSPQSQWNSTNTLGPGHEP